ncbi:hypothetical protein HPB50_022527 [Hyalomma asiaticum]|uniref:Uncharacterized protein n=1 Tax=Hyalomma asiaticum TaxID=266040 RepID=A0ACB7S4N2_HYAAI|nr:hypothetical protein HPB50_022527 [Hyalomma asiaticum]
MSAKATTTCSVLGVEPPMEAAEATSTSNIGPTIGGKRGVIFVQGLPCLGVGTIPDRSVEKYSDFVVEHLSPVPSRNVSV